MSLCVCVCVSVSLCVCVCVCECIEDVLLLFPEAMGSAPSGSVSGMGLV